MKPVNICFRQIKEINTVMREKDALVIALVFNSKLVLEVKKLVSLIFQNTNTMFIYMFLEMSSEQQDKV